MDQLERTAVQLWEAKRLAAHDDVAHGRLALLLLDNAAETSLMRSAQTGMEWAGMYNNMAYRLRDVDPDDEEGQRLKQEIEGQTLSGRKRRQIERNFDDLVDYVFANERVELPEEFAVCLKALHRYRNAAYHRDSVRPDVLGPAVHIYFFLCCHLLKHEQSIMHAIDTPPDGVLAVFDGAPPETSWPSGAFDTVTLGGHVADKFLADLQLDHGRIAAALSVHLLGRIGTLDRHLTRIGETLPPVLAPELVRPVTLRLVQQAPGNHEEAEADPPKDFWTRPLAVTDEVLLAWAEAAVQLADIEPAHAALRAFAEVEQPLEKLEDPVMRFIDEIEREEDRRVDEARGK